MRIVISHLPWEFQCREVWPRVLPFTNWNDTIIYNLTQRSVFFHQDHSTGTKHSFPSCSKLLQLNAYIEVGFIYVKLLCGRVPGLGHTESIYDGRRRDIS
ncbi:unnamed protein product [Allacma fusca]|uniref:Uncharacterized protein n=1 Tax=Allacma fusca TaxID=39272 RepID=A0A8J2PBP8_9HEXA|nr:unnamed protein product [Allacma fusca]